MEWKCFNIGGLKSSAVKLAPTRALYEEIQKDFKERRKMMNGSLLKKQWLTLIPMIMKIWKERKTTAYLTHVPSFLINVFIKGLFGLTDISNKHNRDEGTLNGDIQRENQLSVPYLWMASYDSSWFIKLMENSFNQQTLERKYWDYLLINVIEKSQLKKCMFTFLSFLLYHICKVSKTVHSVHWSLFWEMALLIC